MKRPQDIYEQVTDDDMQDGLKDPGVDYWTSERRKNRWRNVFWTFLVLLVTAGLVVISIMYNTTSDEEERLYFGSRFSPGEEIVSFRKTIANENSLPDIEIVLDDLQDIKILELPDEGSAPLNPQWIKQVAHYLVIAEQAEDAGHAEKALEEYSKVMVIFPGVEGVNFKRGMLNLQMERYSDAISCFKQALTEKTVDPEVVNNLGCSYMATDQYSRAEKCFKKALHMAPELDSARLNLATIYMKTKRGEQASEAFKEYIARNPDDLKASQAFAMLLMDKGNWKEATQLLMKIQQEAPELGPVYFKLGEALSHSANKDAAVETLCKGVVLVDPKKALGWLASDRFDGLRDNEQFQKLINELSSSNR